MRNVWIFARKGVPAKRPLVPFCGRIIALLGDRAFHDDCQRQ